MNKKIIIEALEALIEIKQKEITDLIEDNDYCFKLWTTFIDYIAKTVGRDAVNDAIEPLSDIQKNRIRGYIHDLFEDQ